VAACAFALVCVGSAVSRSAAPFDGASLDVGVETVAGQTYALAATPATTRPRTSPREST
jgi:hypothetical protein